MNCQKNELSGLSKMNSFTFKGKPSWCGCVSLIDGVVEETHSYEEASDSYFHHSLYFSEGAVDRIDEGTSGFFWVDGGIIQTDWRENLAEIIKINGKYLSLQDLIKDQIELKTK